MGHLALVDNFPAQHRSILPCRHILSNVGRVATRDSSRTQASIPDLLTALCEDDSMYVLFRSLQGAHLLPQHSSVVSPLFTRASLVYDRIELLSKSNRPRRNKSISSQATHYTHSERTGSPSDLPSLSRKDSPFTQTDSMESSVPTFVQAGQHPPASRSSLEKVRGIKLFNKAPARTSTDREVYVDAQGAVPRNSESQTSESARRSASVHSDALHEAASSSFEVRFLFCPRALPPSWLTPRAFRRIGRAGARV
jgi:hypothetical protein